MLDLEFEFILEFETAIEKIKQNPNTYPIKHSYKGIDVQVFHMQKFPFVVLYVIDNKLNTITVLSVWQTSRNPKKLNKRFK